MQRRTFLSTSTALAAATTAQALADAPMPMAKLGKTGLQVSRYCVGGYHMRVNGEETAIAIIRRARELGVNFFDSARLYHNGASDVAYGKAFSPAERQKVMLMSKAQVYSYDGAMKLLEETLRDMKTDYLDLWTCHQVATMQEVDQIFAPKGALEAFVKAKQQGKVRHIGFSGHRDPEVHQRLITSTNEWETVQMPINLIDPHYLSFINNVLPKARAKGMGVLAMKSNAMGQITKQSVAKIEDCLRFTWSQDVDLLVSGAETVAQLEQNIGVLKSLKKMSAGEQKTLLSSTAKGLIGSGVEKYKKPETKQAFFYRDGVPVG
jgi:uncharacterized protein